MSAKGNTRIHQWIRYGICASVCGLYSGLMQADAMGAMGLDVDYIASLSLGPAIISKGSVSKSSVYPKFEPTSTKHVFPVGELFLGLSWPCISSSTQLGIAFMLAGNATLSGKIVPAAGPLVDDDTYTYKLRHKHAAIKGKWLFEPQSSDVHPYLSASVGMGVNEARSLTVTPALSSVAIAAPSSTNHNTKSFVFTLGTGVQFPLACHWQAGVGYEFGYWGKSQLGTVPGVPAGYGLTTNKLFTNAIMFTLNYAW